jgi:hypothetical protein
LRLGEESRCPLPSVDRIFLVNKLLVEKLSNDREGMKKIWESKEFSGNSRAGFCQL